jgi:hypothetical protein
MHFPSLLLHHYTSGHGLMGIFESGQLWATSIHQLNDSREFSHSVCAGKAALGRAIPDPDGSAARLREAMANHLDAVSRLAIFVTCFSGVEDSLSQWRGYCPPAFGYSIGFDGDLLRAIAEPQGLRLEKCIYDRSVQDTTADKWAKQAIGRLLPNLGHAGDVEGYVRDNCSPFLEDFVKFAPFLKDSAFKDEHEWRLAGLVPSNDPRLRVRAGRSMLVRYLPIDLKLNKTDPLIWNVRVGPTPHPELATDAVCHYFQKFRIKNGVSPSQTPYRDW